MPFAYAWTDEPYSEDWVVRFHEELRGRWTPEAWDLELGVWAERKLAGIQGLVAEDFASERIVQTGSWLGRGFQGRGYGTEMRTAVLELAFRGLSAEEARSGAIDGNVASYRVSEKLGYRVTGYSTVSPRDEPVRHANLAIRRDEWRPPFPVEIAGLEPALPLFGV
jgi:RimJ/RimL family protein N-acetyltransferase